MRNLLLTSLLLLPFAVPAECGRGGGRKADRTSTEETKKSDAASSKKEQKRGGSLISSDAREAARSFKTQQREVEKAINKKDAAAATSALKDLSGRYAEYEKALGDNIKKLAS